MNAYYAGQQPAVTLAHAFLQDNLILLERGVFNMNWCQIPGLYACIDKMLAVTVSNEQWQKWGAPGSWTVWELATQPEHFVPNLAVVMCKGPYNSSVDPALQGTLCYSMAIACVPDCVLLISFLTLREAFKGYNADTYTAIGLVRLHRASKVFPDVYFQYYQQHFTILGLKKPDLCFGVADEFVGGYFVWLHRVPNNQNAHAMLPPAYHDWYQSSGPVPTGSRYLPSSCC